MKFIVFIVVVNLVVIYVALTMNPAIYIHEPKIKYDIRSNNFYVVISGEGWFNPPSFITVDHIVVELFVGNITLEIARVNLTSNNTPILFEFNTSREFRSEEFNVTIFPDVRLYVNVKGYVPIPANVVALDHNGCYILFYYLPEQLNTTIQLCYYYVDPVLTIVNGEPGELKVLLEVIHVDGNTSSEEYIIKQSSNISTKFPGVIRPLIKQEKIIYSLFDIKIENGKVYLRLSNLIHIVIIVINTPFLISAVRICGKKQVHGRKSLRKRA